MAAIKRPDPNHNRWIFTFGINSALKDRYIVVYGSLEETRRKMFKRYPHWAFQYPDEESAGVQRFNLKPLIFDPNDPSVEPRELLLDFIEWYKRLRDSLLAKEGTTLTAEDLWPDATDVDSYLRR